MSKRTFDQNYCKVINELTNIINDYQSGNINTTLSNFITIIDNLKPEDFALYGKTICHILIDIQQLERWNEDSKEEKKIVKKKTSKQRTKQYQKKTKNDQLDASKKSQKKSKEMKQAQKSDSINQELLNNESDCFSFKAKNGLNNANKMPKTDFGIINTKCFRFSEISNDYYPTFPKWIPTVNID